MPDMLFFIQVLLRGVEQGEGYSGSTVYVGLAGIAFMVFKLHMCMHQTGGSQLRSTLGKEDAALLTTAAAILEYTRPSSVSMFCLSHARLA